ncbi:MAG: ribose 5-phosphate isomerase B [Bacteroidetes bacterium]|nr:ribose 5-phosphate isomerase B [Bacteroidota bacterium]MDA0950493.1 ribose 5-phosphate isomerase B [Bacteroidota bacterium]
MKIALGNDHAGTALKQAIHLLLEQQNHSVINVGTNSEESVDYPDFAHQVARLVTDNEVEMGIVVCGSGNGVNITVNKYAQVRSALCWTTQIAALARQHNDANVIAVPARFVSQELALEMIEVFLSTAFEGGRHQKRVEKIAPAK